MPELKEMIEAIGRSFEEFKASNDLRIKELEKGKGDPVLAEKVDRINAVSYTHLTLPTIYSVQIQVVAVSLKKKT